MAEMVSGATGALQGTVNSVISKGQGIIDSILPPEKRAEISELLTKFGTERPKLATFLASHLALTGFPLGLFIVLTISIAIFALLAAIILGLLGAVAFILVATGFALIILLPTIFFTTAAATFVWLWGWAAYWILQKFNKKEIPGVHKPLGEGLKSEFGDLLGGVGEAKPETGADMRAKAERDVGSGEDKDGGEKEKGKGQHASSGGGGATKKESHSPPKLGKKGATAGGGGGDSKHQNGAAEAPKSAEKAKDGVNGAVKGGTGL